MRYTPSQHQGLLERSLEKISPYVKKIRSFFTDKVDEMVAISPHLKKAEHIGQKLSFDEFIAGLPGSLTQKQKETILLSLVENGQFEASCQFVRYFGIDTAFLAKNSFLKGFIKSAKSIGKEISGQQAAEYLSLYPHGETLQKDIATRGYIEVAYIMRQNEEISSKFNAAQMERIIHAFVARKEPDTALFDIGYDLKTIIEDFSYSPEMDYQKLLSCLKESQKENKGFTQAVTRNFFTDNIYREHYKGMLEDKLNNFQKNIESLDFHLLSKEILETPADFEKKHKQLFLQIATQNVSKTPICVVFRSPVAYEINVMVLQTSELYFLAEASDTTQIYRDKISFFSDLEEHFKKYMGIISTGKPVGIMYFKMNSGKITPPGGKENIPFDPASNDESFIKKNAA